jgi:hypothetical protein
LTWESGERAYYWLSDDEALLLRPDPRTRAHLRILRRNGRTGAETQLAELTERYGRAYTWTGNRASSWAHTMSVSPDGNWLLWTDDQDSLFVTSLDGKTQFRHGNWNTFNPVAWVGWGKAITFVNTRYDAQYATVQSLQPPYRKEDVDMSWVLRDKLGQDTDFKFVSSDHVIALDCRYYDAPVSQVLTYDCHRGRQPEITAIHCSVALPRTDRCTPAISRWRKSGASSPSPTRAFRAPHLTRHPALPMETAAL